MKNLFNALFILSILLVPSLVLAQFTTVQGGTGTSSPSGIIYGDGTLHMKTVTIGSNLLFTGGTLSATGGGLTTDPNWNFLAATGGNYLTPTTTTTGIVVTASSTIGNGTQTGGLTISGGATTTGNAYVAGNLSVATTTASNLLTVQGGTKVFAFNGTQLSLFSPSTGFSGNGSILFSGGGTSDNSLTYSGWNTNVGGITYGSGASLHTFKLGQQSGTGDLQILLGAEAINGTASGHTFVAIGATSTPFARLSVAGSAGGTTPLFAISTSTAAFATSTALQVDANGNFLFGSNGNTIQLGATVATSSASVLTLSSNVSGGSAGGGIQLFRTADQSTNFDLGEITWSGTTFLIDPTKGGTGTTRTMAVGNPSNVRINLNGASPFFQISKTASSGAGQQIAELSNYTSSAASGMTTFVGITPGITQSGTAGFTGLLINPTENTLGTGPNALMNLQSTTTLGTSLVSKFWVDNNGKVGIGSTTPGSMLSIQANNNDTNINLFSIGSSTATATTTLFNVSNIGSTTIGNFGACSGNQTLGTDANGTIICGALPASTLAFGKTWEIDATGQLAPTTTLAVSIPTLLSINDQTFAYGSTTNHATVLGLLAGGNAATTSPTQTFETAIGDSALAANGNGGLRNTSVGYLSLTNNVSGDDNTAVGNVAGRYMTGGFNTAIGSLALQGNSATQTGGNNTAVGYAAGFALNSNSTASSNNTFLGYQAGVGVTSGSFNTFIGSFAGNIQTSGSANIIICGDSCNYPTAAAGAILDIGNVLYGSNLWSGAGVSSAPSTNGILGVSTTSPFAKFSIHANAVDTNQVLFAIGSSTATATSTLFSVTNTGHLIASSTSPVLSACGTSPTMVGDDSHGTVTTGATANGCTVTFSRAYTVAPVCAVTSQTGSVVNTFSYAVTVSTLTTTETAIGGGKFDYICYGLTGQ